MAPHSQLVHGVVQAVVEKKLDDLEEAHFVHVLLVVYVLHKVGQQELIKVDLPEDSLDAMQLQPVTLPEHVFDASCDRHHVTQRGRGLRILTHSEDQEGKLAGHELVGQPVKSVFIVLQRVVQFYILL